MGKNTFRKIIAESKTITPSKPFQDGELLVEPVTRDSILAEEYARMDEECQHDVIAEFTHAATELATTRAALYSAQYFLDKQLPDVRAATQTANSSKEELEKFAATISSAVKDAKEIWLSKLDGGGCGVIHSRHSQPYRCIDVGGVRNGVSMSV